MDKQALGARVAEARDAAGLTQEGLGRAVGLDRTAITRLEKGERKLGVAELVSIAEALSRPLAFFVQEPVATVVSRRSDTSPAHDTTQALDRELETFASDVHALLDMGLVEPARPDARDATPRDHAAAEQMAATARRQAGLDDGGVADLGTTCERLGLLTFAASFGDFGPDGGCVEVTGDRGVLGVAVINRDRPGGRRRMTLAHELGHWLAGDAYDNTGASTESERFINSFAIYFLAPRAAVTEAWNDHHELPIRDRAIAIGARFRLSWTATLSHLRNIELIRAQQFDTLKVAEPRNGDFVRLRLAWAEEFGVPYVSPGFAASCVEGYLAGRLTSARTIQLLRGTLSLGDLPVPRELTLSDFRRSFLDHGE